MLYVIESDADQRAHLDRREQADLVEVGRGPQCFQALARRTAQGQDRAVRLEAAVADIPIGVANDFHEFTPSARIRRDRIERHCRGTPCAGPLGCIQTGPCDGLSNWMDEKGFKTIADVCGQSLHRVSDFKNFDLSYRAVARIDASKCIKCDLCYVACNDTAHQCIDLVSPQGTLVNALMRRDRK